MTMDMAYTDRPAGKRVTFEEPLFINIIESQKERSEYQEFQESRTRVRKFTLWSIAVVILLFLLGGSHVRRCGHHVHNHIRQKFNHTADQVAMKHGQAHLVARDNAIPAAEVCTTGTCKDWADSILSNLAPNYTGIDPCEDFSTYVCGGWREKHDYRADQASVSIGSIMADVNKNILHNILDGEYAANTTFTGENKSLDRDNFDKMKTLYSTCKDEDAIKQYGVAPVRAIVDELEQYYPVTAPTGPTYSKKEELTNAVIWLAKNSVSGFVSAGPTVRARKKADDKNPDTNIVAMGGGEQGLGSKQYYNNTAVVANYTRMTAQMFQVVWTGVAIGNDSIFKDPEPKYMETARKVWALEKRMAFASPDPDKAQEITYYYRPTSLTDMEKQVPEISLTKLLKAFAPAGFEIKTVLNTDPDYYKQISEIINTTPRETIHAYFQSRLIATWAGRSGKDFTLPMRVHGNQMAGRDPFATSERWRTCLAEVDGGLGWILSASFVQRAFSPDAKKLGDRIVSDIKAVFSERLHGFDWMSNSTKEVAAKKVVNIIQKIGYPTASPNIMDPKDLKLYYSNLTTSKDWFQNGRSGAKFGMEKAWRELAQPVDRNRWSMTSATVNAYYNPSGNEIVFPAGIMQLPVFGDDLPEYVSYGAFGAVAGHELTHGFDNNGQHYDQNGRYADWWDNTTLTNFNKKTECFVDQYQRYSVPGLDGQPLHVNGKLTLGENIADAGGLTAAYTAWKKRDKATPNKLMPGLEAFSKDQLFFVSYSNWWCGKVRPAQAVSYIYSDAHSPADKRILGTTANSAAFKEAFKCKSRQPVCELW